MITRTPSQSCAGEMRPLARLMLLVLLPGAIISASTAAGEPPSQPRAKPPKIVLLAGRPSHGGGAHAWEDDARLLQRCLASASNLPRLRVEMHTQGWPQDATALDDAATIVLLSDGFDGHPFFTKAQPERMEVLRKQMARGAGLACIHYAVCPRGRGESEMMSWIGGYYKDGYSRNPIHTALVSPAGDHPICRGWKSFTVRDELYYRIWFGREGKQPDGKGVDGQPTAVPVATAPLPPDKPASETIAWAIRRSDGGRGFGFTGGHFHKNLLLDDYRKLLLNAIVWTAGLDVPKEGVLSKGDEENRE